MENETDILVRLVDSRYTLLANLAQLVEKQAELVRTGDIGRLLSLLAVKQRLLGELVQVDRQLDPFRAQDPEQRSWRSPADRQSCRAVVERSDELLRDITRIERQCEEELVQRRDTAALQIQGMHGAARATQAYGAAVEIPGTHLDLSCET
jgi:hypothetical protein